MSGGLQGSTLKEYFLLFKAGGIPAGILPAWVGRETYVDALSN